MSKSKLGIKFATGARTTECHLFSMQISPDAIISLSGFAYIAEQGWKSRVVGMRCYRPGFESREFNVQNYADQRVNSQSNDNSVDRSTAAFFARIDLREMVDECPRGTFDVSLRIEVILESQYRGVRSTDYLNITSWNRSGPVQVNRAEYVNSDVLVQLKGDNELTINFARKAAIAEAYTLVGSEIGLTIRLERFAATHACLVSGDERLSEVALHPLGDGRADCLMDLSRLEEQVLDTAHIIVRDGAGRKRFVHYSPNSGIYMETVPAMPDFHLTRSSRSLLRIDRADSFLTLDSVAPTGGNLLELRGTLHCRREELSVRLASASDTTVSVPLSPSKNGLIHAYIPFRVEDRTTGRPRVIRQGTYKVEVMDGAGSVVTEGSVGQALHADLGVSRTLNAASVELAVGRSEVLNIKVRSQLTDFERSDFGRINIRRSAHYETTVENTALFECFNGRSAGDNPLPICKFLMAERPELQTFWAVSDYSTVLPEGVKPVLIHSADYYRLVNSSQFYITNNWLPAETKFRSSQRVLQTWHGTPLKTLGLDRFHSGSDKQRKRMREMTSLWDGLLSQNSYSRDLFRDCYAYEGRILESGYPRNDVLVNGASESVLIDLRHRLGLRDEQKVLLYMPTWREDQKGVYDELDLSRLKADLGEGWAILVRGHSMTTKSGGSNFPSGIIDVSLLNDPSLLYLISEILVTDYSSAMFDFTITKKPIAFFAPDIDRYGSDLRGMYFDLPATAPGPLLEKTGELSEYVLAMDSEKDGYSDLYASWNERFNSWDIGTAAAQSVEFLLANSDQQ